MTPPTVHYAAGDDNNDLRPFRGFGSARGGCLARRSRAAGAPGAGRLRGGG